MRQQHPFRLSRRTRCIDLDGYVIRFDVHNARGGGATHYLAPLFRTNNDFRYVRSELGMFGVSYQEFQIRILDDVLQSGLGKPGVQRNKNHPRRRSTKHHRVVLTEVAG